jgi:hypothetical protein
MDTSMNSYEKKKKRGGRKKMVMLRGIEIHTPFL